MSYDVIQEFGRHLGLEINCEHHPPINRRASTVQEAAQWMELFNQCTTEARREHLRWLAKNDLYFLLVHILDIPHQNKPWHMDRCREMEAMCDEVMDLSSRGSGKSIKKTFAKVIQEILKNPEICIGIFSHTRPAAKNFLRPIKETFESHTLLRSLFPDIIWESPKTQSPSWGLDGGITIKRKSVTRREATVEAWGLVDGQPTGMHYDLRVYDDIQSQRETPEAIYKIDDQFQTSMGLKSENTASRWWLCGVFFRDGSVYENLIERKVGLARIRPAINADEETSPIWSDQEVAAMKKTYTPAVWACEIMMDPTKKAEGEGFREEWLKYYDGQTEEFLRSCNTYIVVDPGFGRSVRGTAGKCAIEVIALRADKKKYLVDGIVAGKMTLQQRANWVIAFDRQYRPTKILYEKFGLQADIENLKNECERQGYTGLAPVLPCSVNVPKHLRIEWLVSAFQNGEMILPKHIPIRKINDEECDFMKHFLDLEYRKYPVTKNLDALDCMAWIEWKEAGLTWPATFDDKSVDRHIDWDEKGRSGSWMSS